MVDTSAPIPSASEPVVDRFRRWTPAWYPWIKRMLDTLKSTVEDVTTLTSTVAGNTTSITTINSTIDGIEAHYGVTINTNGRIVGYQRLDSGVTGSTFAVLADKFIIVHPTVDGTAIQAFITGLVAGVPTVGINGNLFVDGSILARSLSVSTLSAISADVGTVTAGVVRSSDSKFVIDLNNKTFTITT